MLLKCRLIFIYREEDGEIFGKKWYFGRLPIRNLVLLIFFFILKKFLRDIQSVLSSVFILSGVYWCLSDDERAFENSLSNMWRTDRSLWKVYLFCVHLSAAVFFRHMCSPSSSLGYQNVNHWMLFDIKKFLF